MRIKFILITSMLMLFLVSCARESLNREKDMSTTTIEDVSEKPEIATETTVEVKIPTVYETIINDIYEALKLEPAMAEIDNGHFSTGIHEIAIYG